MEKLEKILQKHISDPDSEFLQYEHNSIIEAMKEAWNSAVDKCAETAEINIVEFKGIDGWRRTNVKNYALNDGCYFEPNKESILKNNINVSNS